MFPEAHYQSINCKRCGHDYLWPAYGGVLYCGNCSEEMLYERRAKERDKNRDRMRRIRARQRRAFEAEYGAIPPRPAPPGRKRTA